ncbi:MAG: 2-hydroxyacyl-CoA dehydratase family protein [Clostridia bacterium]|nr:2-hydroxyacyl-CoA dehydratase family protein [Clostridia bacterium]
MKDLKYRVYFENLLSDVKNELVAQALDDGKRALGFSCYFIPAVLLNLDGCFSLRLRAPGTTDTGIATYYMSEKTCMFSRSILERAIEGGYNFLSALMGTETCSMMNRSQEHFEMLNLVKDVNDKFYVTHVDPPFVMKDYAFTHYEKQLRIHILDKLRDTYGIDTSDEALMKAIDEHNEVCDVITEIGNFRKQENPPITGYEFHLIELVSEVCPQKLILPYLKETLEEIKARKADEKPWYRVRVVLAGGENDDPYFTKLIEDSGAFVVADRYCYGSLPGRERIEVKPGETPLAAIARHYMYTSQCPRFMSQDKVHGRKQYFKQLAEEYKADGLIVEQMKFCEYWEYERMYCMNVMESEYGLPCLGIEKEYVTAASGQLRTRFQAFVEALELKKIKNGAEVK